MRTELTRLLMLPVFASAAIFSGCAEPAGSGVPVTIPRVFVNCTTSYCRTNTVPNPTITVIFTTSGCDAPDYGSTISGSTLNITCDTTNGCYGEISSWVRSSGLATSTIPSGTYSLCARVDYNSDYPASVSGDSRGVLDDVAVGTSTANQFITSWTDL